MRSIIIGVGLGLAWSGLIVFFAFVNGSTFGQRCANHYDRGTPHHERCVYELSEGIIDYAGQRLIEPEE